MKDQLKALKSEQKGKGSAKASPAVDELQYLLDFNASISQAAAKSMEHLSEFVFITMGNLTLVRRDAYLSHLRTGIKQDTLTALRTAPLHISTLFPDTTIKPAEEEIAQTRKISHSHKLLCQSPQEQLPVGGIASAYRQKCNRTGSKSNFPGVFQLTFSSSQTQQQMETNSGSEQIKPLPQSGEIQNGNTRNHPDIPPTRGVGHLSRLQRRLLPHTNTGTTQEIPQISYPGPDLPIQGTTLWSVHSPHGIHGSGQRGETDGLTQGYKDPPVPRRLVGESQIQTTLSPPHPDFSQNVSKTRLAGEHRKIRIGTKTNLQLRRLPIRPPVRSGQTYTGPVAKSAGQDTITSINTDLFGQTVHVPDRPANSHREASSSGPATHETHSVASQKQLEGSGISREGYPSAHFFTPTSTMVARGKQCATRSAITPNKTCSANIYRRIKRRVGRSLKRTHCKRFLVGAGKQSAHKLSGIEGSVPSLKIVPRSPT